MFKKSLFLIACLFQNFCFADYPIYVLLTHPRGTGTAFEKIVRTHGGLAVVHQPFLDAYLLNTLPDDHPYRPSLDPSATYDSSMEKLFELAQKSAVFCKEQSFMLIDYFKAHKEMISNPQIHFAILVREPAKTLLSYYQMVDDFPNHEIGHEQLWELFNLIRKETGGTPIVIDSDELLKNPMKNLEFLDAEWEIGFKESDLTWEKGFADEWLLIDRKWYEEVGNSTRLERFRSELPRLADGTPEFSEVENLEDRKWLQQFYKYQNEYYLKLLEHAVKLHE